MESAVKEGGGLGGSIIILLVLGLLIWELGLVPLITWLRLSWNAYRKRRRNKDVDFEVDPAVGARRVIYDPIHTYVAHLMETCSKEKEKLAELPQEWRNAVEHRINAYWVNSIQALLKIDEEVTLAALRANYISTIAPFEKEGGNTTAETVETPT